MTGSYADRLNVMRRYDTPLKFLLCIIPPHKARIWPHDTRGAGIALSPAGRRQLAQAVARTNPG